MFGSVRNDGNDDERDPLLIDRRVFNETIDALDEILGGEVGDDRNRDQKEQGRRGVHAGVFYVVE